ncbi:MAG TPA: IscS subfamily cysteine desulfurase, partial [Pseudomonadales bacterium]|nr:IscS subfamily cysteine desulfurase [Pseudomonadales bacterium]
HQYGWEAEEAVEIARRQVADLVNCDPREIVWTSGATESDNLAIKGVAEFYRRRGRHIITSKIEHKAVLDSCKYLERQGWEITALDPDPDGRIPPDRVAAAIRDDTVLVTIMHVNNEIGVVNDIGAIGDICRERKVYFHVDAAQSAGKIDIDLQTLPVDLMSFSAHKVYGPKGCGALFVRRQPRVRIEAQIHGGGHERDMRSGTLATHQVVGMGEAFRIAKQVLPEESRRITELRDRLITGLSNMEAVQVNGDLAHHVPGIVNISFGYVDGEALLMAMSDIAVSSGSACTSASIEPSYVLRAIGLDDELAHSSIRFSLGRFTTEEDIEYAIGHVREVVGKLRERSAAWAAYKDGQTAAAR